MSFYFSTDAAKYESEPYRTPLQGLCHEDGLERAGKEYVEILKRNYML